MDVSMQSNDTAPTLASRIDRMHRRDRLGALAFVAALWFAVIFVLASIWPYLTNGAMRAILTVCGAGLLILNTAAILAMLRHYAGDKQFIYELDLTHLDEMRRRKRIGRP